MKCTAILLLAVSLWCQVAFGAIPKDAVGILRGPKGGMCSAVIVSPSGIILTAEHCGMDNGAVFELGKKKYETRLLYSPPKNQTDEAVALQIVGGADGFDYVPISSVLPQVGDAIDTVGFPHGKRVALSGLIISVSSEFRRSSIVSGFATAYAITVNRQTVPGHSGGPLLTKNGELIGLCSTYGVGTSDWIGWESVTQAYATVFQPPPKQSDSNTRTLVVFTTYDCYYCDEFKKAAKSGAFPGIKPLYVHFDGRNWSNRQLVAEYRRSTRQREIRFPTFWIQGTSDYRVGYAAERRGGLLQWILGVFERIGGAILGDPEPLPIVIPDDPLDDAPPAPKEIEEPYERSAVNRLAGELDTVKKNLADAISLAKIARDKANKFNESGLIGKARAGMALKRDVANAKELAVKSQTDIRTFLDDLKDPWSLLGLLGSLTGLLHRRFAG
jgi:hypothetical protein